MSFNGKIGAKWSMAELEDCTILRLIKLKLYAALNWPAVGRL